MIKCTNILTLIACLTAIGLSSIEAQVDYKIENEVYTQNFDDLPATKSENNWQNNITIPGWFSFCKIMRLNGADSIPYGAPPTINIWNPKITNTGLYSAGNVGNLNRSLGVKVGLSSSDMYLYLALKNLTGKVLKSADLNYRILVWKALGITEPPLIEVASFTTSEMIDNFALTDESKISYIGNEKIELSNEFVSSQNSGENMEKKISSSINKINWEADHYLWIKFIFKRKKGAEAYTVSIDDFSLSAKSAD